MRVKKSSTPSATVYPEYLAKNANQERYVEHLLNPDTAIVLGIGPAGTGKTMFACVRAIESLREGMIEKIVITRPAVAVEEDIGFLPGDINSKMNPWTRPIFDVFLEYYAQKDLSKMMNNGVIEISPLAYMRGRTFKNSFIVADEMQNSTPNQMFMLMTRVGEQSKLVVTGDLRQSDLNGENGLQNFLKRFRKHPQQSSSIAMVEFQQGDVQRSPIVSTVLSIYSDDDEHSNQVDS